MKALTSTPRPAERSAGQGTIYQVATQAGVSIATVSRVLRGSSPVATATRERVLVAVEALRYTPSRSARSLAEGHHSADGVVFPHLSGPYYAEVVLAYEEEAAERGRSVLILSTQGREAARDRVLDLASRVDGMVVLGHTVSDDVLRDLVDRGMSMVLIAREPVPGADAVNAENERGAYALTAHLVGDHGYATVEFLGDPGASTDARQRWDGFVRALADAGVPPPTGPVCASSDEESGRVAAEGLLRAARPRALVCVNDEIALGAIRAAESVGLRVPADLAITGWDDVMAARHARPGLTTVRQPMRELGSRAARLLHNRLAGDTSAAQREVLPTQLVLRDSCGHHPEKEQR